MLRSGHEIPDYSASAATSVVLRLNSGELDEAFVRMLVEEERKAKTPLSLDALIILSTLKNERRAPLSVLARRLQKDNPDALSAIEQLVERGMVEGVGNGASRRYMLSSKVYALSGNKTGYARQKGMTILQEIEMINRHVDTFGVITRAEAAELCTRYKNHAYYLLHRMASEGSIVVVKNGISSYYVRKETQLD